MKAASLRPLMDADRAWAGALIAERWGDAVIVSRGKAHHADQLPGMAAFLDDQPVGLVTYHMNGDQCEIVTLDSLIERRGIGKKLVNAVIDLALENGISRVWLVTTNDNAPALRFYERCEFRVSAVHPGMVDEARKLKPSIPLTGIDGVPIHDEIELEIILAP
jgi:GNAT superfamily N-acetyltransferase